MATLKYISIIILSLWTSAEARTWEKIEIPGAVCGNGEAYSVFIDRKKPDHLLVEFMGGGACWSEKTCYGNSPLTGIAPITQFPTSTIAQESATNPWSDSSVLYLPYCTGDVHSGSHIAHYKPGEEMHHSGYVNVVKAFAYLNQNKIIEFKKLFKITVYGSSAGALGALVHTGETIEPYLNPLAKKLLIADSPGLHFGNTFWEKFSDQLNDDYKREFGKAGLTYARNEGLLAPHMGPVYMKLIAWQIGILQSTRDLVMSIVFGNISSEDHRTLVLSDQGIQAVSRFYPNVQTWIAESVTHTFLVRGTSYLQRDKNGETAWSFAVRLYGKPEENKKSPSYELGLFRN